MSNKIPPVQLWIGQFDDLIVTVYNYLKSIFCKQKGCGSCLLCRKIEERQWYSVVWVEPEKIHYGSAHVDAVLAELAFMLDEDELRFIVITQADNFTIAAANRLLKVFEEPPRGYHFMLLAENKERILPTIISRAVVTEFAHKQAPETTELYKLFIEPSSYSLSQATQLIDKAQLHEYEAQALGHKILVYYAQKVIDGQNTEIADIHAWQQKYSYVQHLLEKPPMPGSSKFFLRTLFLMLR